jgi:hypothetical protein
VNPSNETIFISHVNGDPDAEPVLKALVEGLKKHLVETHQCYELQYDREIVAGANWRNTIYQWLHGCAGAIVLVSQQAFKPDKPWVSHEATALTIIQTFRRDLCIIPVHLQGAERLMASQETFKPGRLNEIQAFRFPDPSRFATLEEFVSSLAERLKQELPRCGNKSLVGLGRVLQEALSEFPDSARKSAAGVFDVVDASGDAAWLAQRFLAADEVKVQQAFFALCNRAPDARFLDKKRVIANVLGAQKVQEEHAKLLAVEAAIPTGSGCGRALLLESEDLDVVDLYLTRAAQRSPHGWDITYASDVLEFGQLDDLKRNVRKILTDKFGKAAGRSEDIQLRRGTAVVRALRRSGFPVLLRLDYCAYSEPAAAFRAVQEVCPELMVLYTATSGAKLSADPAVQIMPLGAGGYDDVIGPYGALIAHCRNTARNEEATQ